MQNTYDSINFSSNNSANSTLQVVDVGVFLCPADAGNRLSSGMTSYGFNGGTNDAYKNTINAPFSPNALKGPVGYAQLIDGSASPAISSEWLLGVVFGSRDLLRTTFSTPEIDKLDKFAVMCATTDVNVAKLGLPVKGSTWLSPSFGESIYNHALGPNGPTCTNDGLTGSGAWTAGSSHADTCNVAFADAHVQPVKRTVSLSVWRAIGTMNGLETVDSSSF